MNPDRRSLSDLARNLEELDRTATDDYPVMSLAVLLSDEELVPVAPERGLYRVNGEVKQVPKGWRTSGRGTSQVGP